MKKTEDGQREGSVHNASWNTATVKLEQAQEGEQNTEEKQVCQWENLKTNPIL